MRIPAQSEGHNAHSSQARDARLQQMRITAHLRRAMEILIPDDLDCNRICREQQLATEQPEERAAHLEQLRVSQQERHATEQPEERVAHVESFLSWNHSTEQPEERAACLEQLRVSQQERRATEQPEERAARLEQLRVSQQATTCH